MTTYDEPEVLDVPGVELAPIAVSALVRPAGTPADVAEAFTEYADVCERVLDDTDYQAIGGKKYRTKSAWRKLAVAYGVNLSLTEERTERTDDGALLRVHCTVRAEAPNGRYADGLGSCDATERKFAHMEHDVRGTAYTRAANRACADLFGLGEVSAEEMSAGGPSAPALASAPTMKSLVAAARQAKADGVPVGDWPEVLGTPVFDVDAKVPLVNEGTAQTLLRALIILDAATALPPIPDTAMPDDDKPAALVCRGCKDPITGEGEEQLPQIVDGDAYHPACAPM